MNDVAKLTLRIESLEAVQAAKRLDQLEEAARRAERGANRAGRSTDLFSRRLRGLNRIAASVSRALVGIAASFGLIVGATKAFRALESFEFSMAQVRAVAIDTTTALEDQIQTYARLETAARAFGATTEFSASQAAEAQLALGRAGFTSEEILASLGDTLDLATAGVLELGKASKITSNTIRQFGLEADQTKDVVDTLVFTANKSNTTVGELGQAMSLAGSLASSLGLSVKDTAAFLGILANRGITASKAGTNLRGVMARLLNPTGEAADIIERLAKQSGIARINFNVMATPLENVIKNLRDAGASAKDLETIFGRFQVTGALGLVDAADELIAFRKEMGLAGDEASRVAGIMRDTLRVDVQNLGAALEALVLAIGDTGLTDALRGLIQFMTGVIRDLAGINNALVEITPAARTFANVLRGLGVAIAAQIAIHVIWEGAIVAYTLATKGATVATALFNAVLYASPLGVVALAIGGLVFWLYQFRDGMIQTRDGAVSVSSVLGAVWDTVVERVVLMGEITLEVLNRILEQMVLFAKNVYNLLKVLATPFIKFARGIIERFDYVWEELYNGLKTVVDSLASLIVGLIETVKAVVDPVIDTLKAISEIDFSSPIKSFSRISAAASELTLDKTAERIGKGWTRAMDFSLVDTSIALMKRGGENSRKAFVEGLDLGSLDFADLLGLGGAVLFGAGLDDAFQENLRKRIAAARAAVEAETQTSASFLKNLEKDLEGTFAPVTNKLRLLTKSWLEQIRARREAAQEGLDELEKMNQALDFDLLISNNTNRDIAQFVELQRVMGAALQATHGDFIQAAFLTEQYRQKLKELAETQDLRRIGESVGDALGSFFEDLIFQVKSADEAIKDLTKSLLKLAFQEAVTAPLREGFASIFGSQSAKGNIFESGRLRAFASGGGFDSGRLITSPTVFTSPGGDLNLGGELGTEAIMPLKRLANGNLGIEADMRGGGGQQAGTTVVQHFTINTPDANSFRKSRKQFMQDMREAASPRTRG